MTSLPHISIIIPLYNHEHFITDAVISVLEQHVPDVEIIIINDGSTDRSECMVKGIRDDRIRYYSQENQGAHATINRGIQLSQGQFIGILNSDDLYSPSRLNTFLDIMHDESIDAVFSHLGLIDSDGRLIRYKKGSEENWSNQDPDRSFKYENNVLLDLIAGNFLVTTSNLFCRKSVFSRTGYFREFRYAHDYDFFLRLAYHCRVHIVDDSLLFYRIHHHNTYHGNDPEVALEVAAILADFFIHHDLKTCFPDKDIRLSALKLFHSIQSLDSDRIMMIMILFGLKYGVMYPSDWLKEETGPYPLKTDLLSYLKSRAIQQGDRDTCKHRLEWLSRENDRLSLALQHEQNKRIKKQIFPVWTDCKNFLRQFRQRRTRGVTATLPDFHYHIDNEMLDRDSLLKVTGWLFLETGKTLPVRATVAESDSFFFYVARQTPRPDVVNVFESVRPELFCGFEIHADFCQSPCCVAIQALHDGQWKTFHACQISYPDSGNDQITLSKRRLTVSKSKIPLVSVVMPVCNGMPDLEKAVQSVLFQSLADFEFIIVDDGSCDDSLELIQQYVKQDNRIRYIRNKNRMGTVASLNKGLAASHGQFVARQGAGDISLSDRFLKQHTFLSSNQDVGILGSAMKIAADHTGAAGIYRQPESDMEIRFGLLLGSACFHSSIMMRKSVLDKNGLVYRPDFEPAEDYDFLVRLLSVTRGHNDQEVLVEYRIHPETDRDRLTDQPSIIADKISTQLLRDMNPCFHFSRNCKTRMLEIYLKGLNREEIICPPVEKDILLKLYIILDQFIQKNHVHESRLLYLRSRMQRQIIG